MNKIQQKKRLAEFKRSVTNRFNIYNSPFVVYPMQKCRMWVLEPLLFNECEKGLAQGKKPQEIMDNFFNNFTDFKDENARMTSCSR